MAGATRQVEAIVPSAARELVERLTSALEIPFTITDEKGGVVASTGGRARGQIEVNAFTVVQQRLPMEVSGEAVLRWHLDALPPAAEVAAYTTGAALYLPLPMAGAIAGALIAHGEPDDVRTRARVAAVAASLGLEFARAATLMAREGIGPDLALHRLLRGSRSEAREASAIAKVAGWELDVPRTALVVIPSRHAPAGSGALDDQMPGVLAEVLGRALVRTPAGKLRRGEWVVLAEREGVNAEDARNDVQALAAAMRARLEDAGTVATIGVGEHHPNGSRLVDLRRSYRDASYAARWGERIRREPGIYDVRSLGSAAFVVASGPTRERHAEVLLAPLRDRPDVLLTLREFLGADLSLGAAARRSSLHRHTVRSHLERVHTLTGLNPRSLDDALQLRLAMLVTGAAAPNGG